MKRVKQVGEEEIAQGKTATLSSRGSGYEKTGSEEGITSQFC